MRKILSFVSPELGITYHELYQELALHVAADFDETTKRFAPDEAVTALRYYRRMADRRETFAELSQRLNVSLDVVYAVCSTEGAKLLLTALTAQPAIA